MNPVESGSADERQVRPTGGRWKGVVQLLIILVVAAAAIYFARAPRGVPAEPADGAAPTSRQPTVSVTRPAVTSAAREVMTTGVVSIQAGVGLRSRVAGEVAAVSPALRSGGSFTADQPLLWIDPVDQENRLESAQAQLRVAQARLQLQELKAEARTRRFQQQNPGAEVPPLVARVAQIARERARVERATAAVRSAKLALARTTLSLPFDGWVIVSSAAVGQVVGPASPLGQVFAKDALQVEADVSEEDLANLEPVIGRAATVQAAGRSFEMVVERVATTVDLQSRLITLYLAFPADTELEALPRPGTFANVVLAGPPLDGVIVLPEAAEQFNGSVWVVDGGVLRSFVPRSLGRTQAGWLVEAFDTAQGVVIGRVAQARAGLPVTVGPVEASGS